jgi:hypothetical protein
MLQDGEIKLFYAINNLLYVFSVRNNSSLTVKNRTHVAITFATENGTKISINLSDTSWIDITVRPKWMG